MDKITIKINNGKTVEVYFDNGIKIIHKDENGLPFKSESITDGDFIMMLNWYYYQKSIGNKDLKF
jgi:hypothetical protein